MAAIGPPISEHAVSEFTILVIRDQAFSLVDF